MIVTSYRCVSHNVCKTSCLHTPQTHVYREENRQKMCKVTENKHKLLENGTFFVRDMKVPYDAILDWEP